MNIGRLASPAALALLTAAAGSGYISDFGRDEMPVINPMLYGYDDYKPRSRAHTENDSRQYAKKFAKQRNKNKVGRKTRQRNRG